MTKRLLCLLWIAGLVVVPSLAQQRLTLLFAGDLMQHQAQIDAARRSATEGYDYSACFGRVRDQIAAADLAIANLEVTLAGPPYRGYPAFSAPDAYLEAVRDAGFDILTTGNNHCLDRGRRGLERTIARLDDLGIPHAGTYVDSLERSRRYPLLVQKNGFLIAFLSYTYETNGVRPTGGNIVNYIDRHQIQRDILSAKSRQPDAIIALMHWGDEYQSLPSREQRRLADWLLAQGVTHIVGCHPHVVQPMELRTEGWQQHVVVYSLGNFLSNMQQPRTDGGLVFTMTLEKYPLPTAPIGPPFASAVPFNRLDSLCYRPDDFPAGVATTNFSSSFSFSPSSSPSSSSSAAVSEEVRQVPAVAYPYCRLVDCGYRLVWTARPPDHPGSNFVVWPIAAPVDSLSQDAQARLSRFASESRQLLRANYGGIDERVE